MRKYPSHRNGVLRSYQKGPCRTRYCCTETDPEASSSCTWRAIEENFETAEGLPKHKAKTQPVGHVQEGAKLPTEAEDGESTCATSWSVGACGTEVQVWEKACRGNICRSPITEAIQDPEEKVVEEEGFSEKKIAAIFFLTKCFHLEGPAARKRAWTSRSRLEMMPALLKQTAPNPTIGKDPFPKYLHFKLKPYPFPSFRPVLRFVSWEWEWEWAVEERLDDSFPSTGSFTGTRKMHNRTKQAIKPTKKARR